jgi:hypothetical protein
MKFQDSAIGRMLLPLGLLTMAAAALVGCDRHAVSQTPSPLKVETAPPADAKEPAAAGSDSTPSPTEPAASDAAAQQPAPKAAVAAAPPASDGPPRPASQRPKADRTAVRDGVEKITFDDLILGMEKDMVYRPWMLESETNGGRAKELEGKVVRLSGIMHGGVRSTKKNKEFVLLRNKECKFGPGGQADHLAKIFMKDGKTVSYTEETVTVEGTLRIKPEMGDDGNTWSIYEIEGAEAK